MIDIATATRAAAARGFVRSLNILLKFAKMYDFGHPRTAKQYETAWTELKTALGSEDDAGLLLAVSGDNLLLDGTPLDSAAAEKSFARMLSAAGIASIHFGSKTTQQSLARFVRGFPTGFSSKPTQLAEQLKAALQGDANIHVNEVCFVPADSAIAKTTIAATLAAKTLGMTAEQTDELLSDPEKLLQLLMAADGAKSGRGPGNGPGDGSETVGAKVGGPGDGNGGGAGTWNIIGAGGSKGGTRVDSNAGGFWFSKEGEGAAVEGAIAVVEGTSAYSGSSGGWNIVSGTGEGKSIDPNVGGFWFTKDGSGFSEGSATPIQGSGSLPVSVESQFPSEAALAVGGSASGSTVAAPGESAASRATRWGRASAGIRTARAARGGAGSMSVETGLMTLQQDELQGIMQVLGQIARTSEASQDTLDPRAFQSRLSTLPRRARFTVSQALAALAAQAPTGASDKPTLLKLAEHIAIRFALESYERGDVEVNNVRELLGEMSAELDGLRKILGVYEAKMHQAGIHAGSAAEILTQEFWTHVSEEKKKEVIESSRAWCVPPVRLREYVEARKANGDLQSTEKALSNYGNCIRRDEPEARRQTALGLAQLAELYGKGGEKLLAETIRTVGVQLAAEQDSELQSLVSAAFVRLSQEAGTIRSYAGLQESVQLLHQIETKRPGSGKGLRPKINVENSLPAFIDEALKAGRTPNGLSELLSSMAEPAAEQIAAKFGRVGFREDCELLIAMMNGLGPAALEHLRNQLQHGNVNDAIDTIGILARMDLDRLEQVLPDRMREWKRTAHDRIVRRVASSGAPERGRLLLQLFDGFDPLIRPLAIDEIGMSGEIAAGMRLLRIVEGDLPRGSGEYLRLKAIEAIGRLRTTGSEAILRKVAEERKAFRWANPSELRIVAAQALEKIDPEWMRDFVPRSGLNIAEFSIELLDSDPNSSAIRQRRYPRLRLERPVQATTMNLKDNCQVDISEIGLGGGVAVCEQSLHPGNVVELKLNAPQKSIKAQTIVRDANTQARAFEVVDMNIEERAKLRKLLVQFGNVQKQSTPNERNRTGGRTILVTG